MLLICYYLYGYLVPGKICYDPSVKTPLGALQLNLTAEEELEIEYEVDGWFYVSCTWFRNTTHESCEEYSFSKLKPNRAQFINYYR